MSESQVPSLFECLLRVCASNAVEHFFMCFLYTTAGTAMGICYTLSHGPLVKRVDYVSPFHMGTVIQIIS